MLAAANRRNSRLQKQPATSNINIYAIMLWLALLLLLAVLLGTCTYNCCRNPDSTVAKFARAASDLSDQYNEQYIYREDDNDENKKES